MRLEKSPGIIRLLQHGLDSHGEPTKKFGHNILGFHLTARKNILIKTSWVDFCFRLFPHFRKCTTFTSTALKQDSLVKRC